MESASVVPDGKIVLLPSESDLKVVVTIDVLIKESEQTVRFMRSQFVNLLGKDSVDKETLPAGDGVGPDDRMDSAQVLADVLRSTSRLSQGGVGLAGHVNEMLTDVGGSETFEEGPVCGGKTVVRLVRGSPESVTTDFGKGSDLKSGVVRRVGLKGDIRMPESIAERSLQNSVITFLEVLVENELVGDNANLITKLTSAKSKRVDV